MFPASTLTKMRTEATAEGKEREKTKKKKKLLLRKIKILLELYYSFHRASGDNAHLSS